MGCAWSVRATARSTARPRQSSPMPGPASTLPLRVTRTSVPFGKTVSRWALTTTRGPLSRPGRSPSTLPSWSIRTRRETGTLEKAFHHPGPRGLAKRRRGHFADGNLRLDGGGFHLPNRRSARWPPPCRRAVGRRHARERVERLRRAFQSTTQSVSTSAMRQERHMVIQNLGVRNPTLGRIATRRYHRRRRRKVDCLLLV